MSMLVLLCWRRADIFDFNYGHMGGGIQLYSSRDSIVLRYREPAGHDRWSGWESQLLGFDAQIGYPGNDPQNSYVAGVRIAYWALAVLFAIFPVVLVASPIVRRWRRWRHPPGTCIRCGYDLRASKDRCPECGTLIEPVTPPAPTARTEESASSAPPG
jgi:hypothetical protein